VFFSPRPGAEAVRNFLAAFTELLPVGDEAAEQPQEEAQRGATKTLIMGIAVAAPLPQIQPEPHSLVLGRPLIPDTDGNTAAPSGLATVQAEVTGQPGDVAALATRAKAPAPSPARADLAIAAQAPPPDLSTEPRIMSASHDAEQELPNLAFREKFTPAPEPETTAARIETPVLGANPEPATEPKGQEPAPEDPLAAVTAKTGSKGRTDQAETPLHAAPDSGNAGRRRSNDDDASGSSGRGVEPALHGDSTHSSGIEPAAIATPQRETQPASTIHQPPASRTPQNVSAQAEPIAAQPASHPQTGEARTISLRVADGTEQRVELKVTERAGEVRVEVRAGDADLAGSLRENLGDLVRRVEQNGLRAEGWHPVQAGSLDSRMQDRRAESQSFREDPSGRQSQPQSGGEGQRGQQQSEPNRWFEEMEGSTSENERSMPTWLASSIR
jgi:hypothetical protein